MSHFICPICKKPLHRTPDSKSLCCADRHSFDMAKSGYVNLLMSQQPKAKRHGDDKLMVRSRQAFLDKGYYRPLLDALCDTIRRHARRGSRIFDAGCGECWYTASIHEYLLDHDLAPALFAADISKDALAAGAKRDRRLELAVASVFHLPVGDLSCDIVLSVFAPFCAEEFTRVLRKDGVIIRVIPLEKHLLSLKAAVYDSVYENKTEAQDFEGLVLIDRQEIRGTIHLENNEDILNVFSMTPYYYKTGAKDQEKLSRLTSLDTEIEFGILTYRKA
jgi:23S rRNA (guanine745-N1)-methyltransferase